MILKTSKLKKGFTLVELLVVIAVLGVLATGLLLIIDPADKIAAGNDARAISDVNGMAHAVENYVASRGDGVYPTTCAALVSGGELKTCPANPPNHTENFAVTAGGGGTINVDLDSKKYTATPFYKYEVSTGKSCVAATLATAC